MAAQGELHPSCTSKGISFILGIKANDSILIKVAARRVEVLEIEYRVCPLAVLCLRCDSERFDPCQSCLTQF